jgi:predicted phosphodiesterase
VRGNHDARGNFAHSFLDLYPTWTNQPYYAFRHGPVFFIVIDGGEDKPDSDIEYFGTAAFDLYREAEGEWLKGVIASEEFKSAPYRVILSHIPLNDNSWHGGRHAWKHLCQTCENHGVQLMISGHTHRYRYNECGKHNETFPTLEFGPKQYLDVTADKEKMTVLVKKNTGEVMKTFTYLPNKK